MESDSNESTKFIQYPELGEPEVTSSATPIIKIKKTRFSPAEVVHSETTSETLVIGNWSKKSKSKFRTCGIHLGVLICGVLSVVAIFSTILGVILWFQGDSDTVGSDTQISYKNDKNGNNFPLSFENLEKYKGELMNITNTLVAAESRTTGELENTGDFDDGNILMKCEHNLDDETGEMLVYQVFRDVEPMSLIEIYKNTTHRKILSEFDRKYVVEDIHHTYDMRVDYEPELRYNGTFDNPNLWFFKLHYKDLNDYKANAIVKEAHNMPIADFEKDTSQHYIWCFYASENLTLAINEQFIHRVAYGGLLEDPFLIKHLDCNLITSGENGGVEVLSYRWSEIMNKKRKVKVAFGVKKEIGSGFIYRKFGKTVFEKLIKTTEKQRELALEFQQQTIKNETTFTQPSDGQNSLVTSQSNLTASVIKAGASYFSDKISKWYG